MSKIENTNDVVLSDSIFTPVMDVKTATKGFKDFQRLKMEILQESDIVEIMGKPHVKKSGWNKLALFFGVSTRTVSSKKVHNPDDSYEWEVTVEAYKITKDGFELYKVQRSALVSSLEKEKSEGQKNSPRKSHDVFASAETRAEGRALAAFFGTGEVTAEEMDGISTHNETPSQNPDVNYCRCSMKDTKFTATTLDDGLFGCLTCGLPIAEHRYKTVKAFLEKQKHDGFDT